MTCMVMCGVGLDAWHPDYKDAPTNGNARMKSDSTDRVLRGGSYPDPPDMQRSAFGITQTGTKTRTGRLGFDA